MANKTSRLQGWAERPSIPGWEKRALQEVKARQKKSKRWTERKDGVNATFDMPLKTYLNEAAKRRGLSMAGYARRAICAFIAHDLDIPFEKLTQYCAMPTPFRVDGGHGRHVKSNDDGEGFGPWRIKNLK